MEIFRTFTDPCALRGATVAMGNFDGVHLGHQSVLNLAREAAPEAPWGCVTFEPHPRRLFQPDAPEFRLMSANARANRLQTLGLDVLYEVPFTRALSALSPEDFVGQLLVGAMGVSRVVVGSDFRFGKGRAGDLGALRSMGTDAGFSVTEAPLIDQEGREISSTAIRAALADGYPRDAASMLGHWHRVEGAVEHGFKRGRELGFPTANVGLGGLHLPRFGVYAVLVDVLTGPQAGRYQGAASIGVRPMFDDQTAPNLEVYLLDFEGDLYEQTISVALVEFLRPEETFDGLNAFITQMHADCAQARDILAQL
ncbi:MAG: bifunctional riboflavin kinase/FAD synthetase [Pseudomonadota bacterium]